MLTVTYAECHIKAPYAECRYAECRYAECCYTESRYAECRGAKCAYVIFYNIFCYFHVPVPAAGIQTLSLRITSLPFYHSAPQIDGHCQCQFFKT